MRLRLAQAAEVRLGRQRAPQYEVGEHLVPYLRSANVVDGSLDLSDVKSMNFDPAEQAIFGLADGDVLMTEGSGSIETVGTSAVWRADLPGTVCFQNTLLRLRPRAGVTDGRFLAWWARHAHASGQIAAVSSGANIQHIGSDGLKDLGIRVPNLEGQRRIADFLDDRVARIDQLVAARTDQLSLAYEQRDAEAEAAFSSSPVIESQWVRLVAACEFFSDGDWIESPYITLEGVRLIQTGNVGVGEYREQGFRYVSHETFRGLKCTPVHAGDVLISRLASPVARACRCPELGAAIASVDVTIARPQDWVDRDFLVEFLSSPRHLADADELARGATMQRVSRSQLGSIKIPNPPSGIQQDIVRRLKGARCDMKRRVQDIQKAIQLMNEYKQSLITAAVTGQIDVTTAGSGIPG